MQNRHTHTGLAAMALLLSPALALAHPGHGLDSAAAGFMHPLTGWDHLLVMLAVGLWAGRLGGAARWQLPLTFLLVMLVGALAGMGGLTLPAMETGIAASVMAIGLLIALHVVLKPLWQVALVALFALLHGVAHGAELVSHSALMVLPAMLTATALLHMAGLLLASRGLPLSARLQQAIGGAIALAGGWMLFA
ncbi:urease accessory protein [Methylovorus glucosotrophus]|uniref:HupE/UreJ family protein n=1 Tax=Methylovorus glucosotrophus TaxID=266009 RepID=UPI001331A7A8|nr:HupE/UreJ family protein [Methylovorus glucosotrophus]KAF0844700.1 urease accessory protein [Methylovorus glucosotrophus]